ncbi:MAG TPA: type I restriction enzyme HsdR N-terminal domain-containing protein [Chitinophagales bacterium]|nr:type I restriction enzyme HsdR N-terminal domain-containing protein [Chitinophagales bacterium]
MNIVFKKYDFRIQREGDQSFIFDIIRKKFVALTPEEWVRQHWIHYLIEEKKYPRSLFALEKMIELNQLAKRCDIVIYNREGKPFLIVECKSPDVKISQKVFDQIARYNLTLRVKYLVVSNGSEHHCCEIDFEKKTYDFLPSLPEMK